MIDQNFDIFGKNFNAMVVIIDSKIRCNYLNGFGDRMVKSISET